MPPIQRKFASALILAAAPVLVATSGDDDVSAPAIPASKPSPPRASSSLRPGRLDTNLGIYAGVLIPNAHHELYNSREHFHAPFQSVAPKVGLRMGFFPLRLAGVEVEAGYAPVRNERDEQNHIFDLRSHFVLQAPWRWSPFLLAGGGLIGVTGDTGGDIDGALHWGAGLKYHALRWLKLRFDGRHIISARQGPNAGNTHHAELSLGLDFVLYRHPEPPPPSPVVPQNVPPKEEPPPIVVEVDRTIYVNAVDPVRFGFDSFAVDESFVPILKAVAELMLGRPELDVVIVGHADAIGTEIYNDDLSLRRAQAIADFLLEQGVELSRMRIRGDGERIPLASNRTPEGRSINRRTEVTVVERRIQGDEPLEAEAVDPSELKGPMDQSELLNSDLNAETSSTS